jgi:hypothetical protein
MENIILTRKTRVIALQLIASVIKKIQFTPFF